MTPQSAKIASTPPTYQKNSKELQINPPPFHPYKILNLSLKIQISNVKSSIF